MRIACDRLSLIALVAGSAAWCVGCEPSASGPPPAVNVKAAGPVPAAVADPGAGAESAVAAASPRLELSAGVALPQSLPDGTAIMCSVDYRWVGGAAEPGVEYIWVVELGNGQQLSGPAQVRKNRGTIQMILQRVKPDQGPFKAGVFAKRPGAAAPGDPISDSVPLR